ncbi:MAG TPA: cyclic nucleotide-binding domain-containing protein [Actinomycetota bacterium]|nr:cyclic nucleotide-binding domain-containing protein [Actinomycetota bacterium]
MRFESSVTSVSWIPSEAIRGLTKLPFEMGVTQYDDPPPDVIEDLGDMLHSGRVRFANVLRAWIEVEDGRIVEYGHMGQGHIGMSKIKVGPKMAVFPAVAFDDLRPEPELRDGSVRFIQTAGGRTSMPAPRRVRHKPYIQITSPTAWTTLALTINSDGTSESEVLGASTFPRHWIYDNERKLVAKSGLIDFKTWYREAFGEHTPWGDQDSPALVTEVETALERELSLTMMRGGAKPKIKKLAEGQTLVEQGQPGDDMFLLLDGVLTVEVDGEPLAELGPGAVVGERAILEGGTRTSTLRAITASKVAVASGDQLNKDALVELSEGHRREENR